MQNDWNDNSGSWNSEDGWGEQTAVSTMPKLERETGAKRFHLSMLIHGLIGALIGAGIGDTLYQKIYDPSGSNVLMVGIILGLIAGCVLLACAICELRTTRITIDRELNFQRLLFVLVGAAAVFAAGCLVELVYELGSAYAPTEFNDFVFVIDDSGSMETTDPQDLRYAALEQLLDSMGEDRRAGLIRFVDTVYTEPVEMDYLTTAQKDRLRTAISEHRSNGNTNIYAALQEALAINERDRVVGRNPVVVLLSDGGSSVPVNRVAEQFLDAGVAVSTVSLGNNTDETLLQNLAQATGGQYYKVEQAEELVQAFQKVSTAISYRCLFSPRPGNQRGNVLYMVMRVVFLALPGLLIGLFLIVMLRGPGMDHQLLVSGIAGLLAGLVMEIGTFQLLPLSGVHLVSWLLYGVVLLMYVAVTSNVRQSEMKQIHLKETFGSRKRTGGEKKSMNKETEETFKRIDRDSDGDWGL